MAVCIFHSANEFCGHLQQAHSDSFTEAQLPFLVARAKRHSLFPFKMCPFCESPELDLTKVQNLYSISGMDYEHLQKEIQLQKHIALHIQNFSLLAFLESENDTESRTRSNSAQGSSSKVSSISLEFEDEFDDGARDSIEHNIKNEDVPELDAEVDWNMIPPPNVDAEQDPVLTEFFEAMMKMRQGEIEKDHLPGSERPTPSTSGQQDSRRLSDVVSDSNCKLVSG